MIFYKILIQGNLCRCTGYRPILEGYKAFTSDAINDDKWAITANGIKDSTGKDNATNGCGMGQKCCKLESNGGVGDESNIWVLQ